MKFLIDNQLPLALATMLTSKGHRASHVLDLGLEAATDSEIWNYAAANSLVLITKDEDFSYRASQPNASVQVVWVRQRQLSQGRSAGCLRFSPFANGGSSAGR